MTNEQTSFQEKSDTNIFVQILQKYLPFWPLFVITTGIGISVAYLLLRSKEPVYITSAKVLLKDPNSGGGDSKVLDALNIFGEKKIVDNEILVLKSSSIVQEVVKNLNLYTTVFNQGKVRKEELYGKTAPVYFIARQKDSIFNSEKYFFSVNWKNGTIEINNQTVPFSQTVMLGNVNYQVLFNPGYNQAVEGKNFFLSINPVDEVAGVISDGIRAAPFSNVSTVLDVKIETPVPEKGEAILRNLFVVYNAQGIEDKNAIAYKTLNFIEDRLGLVIRELDSVEKNIVAYRSRESLINVSAQSELYLAKVTDLDKAKGDIDLQLDILNNIENYVRSKAKNTGTVPSLNVVQDPILSNLLTELYTAEFNRDKVTSISGERSEPVLTANNQIEKIKQDIKQNLVNIRSGLLTSKNDVVTKINQNNNLLRQVPQKERGLLEISRQQAVKNSIYSFLLQKREETAISSSSTSSDLRIIERPNSGGQVRPIPKNFYLGGFIIGLLAAVLFVLIKEQFQSTILFKSEIESKTTVPFVGEISQSANKEPIVILEGKRTIIAEQFRALRTNLGFLGFDDTHKTLLVTSSISGEGKSFVAINLAISITLTGKRVALMEMDLRKPKVSKLLNIAREPGISNFIAGKVSFEQVVKETEIPRLFVIPAGIIPPNPTELIGKPGFIDLMQQVKNNFDYVIIDTAPIGPVTDALLLKKYADVTLYVIRHGRTPKIFIRMINELKITQKFNNICLVFNGIKKRGIMIGNGKSENGYGSGYGSGYGYSYGYASDEEQSGLRNLLKKIKNGVSKS